MVVLNGEVERSVPPKYAAIAPFLEAAQLQYLKLVPTMCSVVMPMEVSRFLLPRLSCGSAVACKAELPVC
jgi:hypothetical protein